MTDQDIKTFEFDGAAAIGGEDEEVIGKFALRGETYYIRALVDSSVAVLVHRTRNGSPDVVLASVLNFTEKALVPESAKRFADICLDPVKGLKMAQIVEVFTYILGVVGANPTGSSTDSSAPQPKTGGPSRRTAAR